MYNKIMDLNEIVIFIQVVQSGSFTQAAKKLGMPNSTVSSKISSLEARLGITLIKRTTRQLKITPAGEAYFKKCLRGLDEIHTAEDEIAATKAEPQGLFRLTAPVDLGSGILAPIVADYSARYPQVAVEILMTDRRVDLLAENFDLAIRAGPMRDSTLIAKKLGEGSFLPYASADYIKKRGKLINPKDLLQHHCICYPPLGTDVWNLVSSSGQVKAKINPKMVINDLNMIKSLVVAGVGVALLPTYYCKNEVKLKELTSVLPGWRMVDSPIHFVYPAQKFVSPKLKAFIEMATVPIQKALTN